MPCTTHGANTNMASGMMAAPTHPSCAAPIATGPTSRAEINAEHESRRSPARGEHVARSDGSLRRHLHRRLLHRRRLHRRRLHRRRTPRLRAAPCLLSCRASGDQIPPDPRYPRRASAWADREEAEMRPRRGRDEAEMAAPPPTRLPGSHQSRALPMPGGGGGRLMPGGGGGTTAPAGRSRETPGGGGGTMPGGRAAGPGPAP